jgi:hypothetical protein
VNPRAFEPDLDGLPSVDVADYPTRFKHNPRIGLRRVVRAALGDLHAVNEDKNVTVFIPLNLANRFLMVHGYPTLWVRLAFPGARRPLGCRPEHRTRQVCTLQFELLADAVLGLAAGAVEVLVERARRVAAGASEVTTKRGLAPS